MIRLAILLALAAPAAAGPMPEGPTPMAEVWVWPAMFQQSLAPLGSLAATIVRDGSCPGLAPAADGIIHRYEYETRLKRRGQSNVRYELADLRLTSPSGCAALDAAVTDIMRGAVPAFAQPRRDEDRNGWLRLPSVLVRVGS